MRVFESVPVASLRPGDEVAYDLGTQFIELVVIGPEGATIRWADSQEPTTTVSKSERIHRVVKADSEERKARR